MGFQYTPVASMATLVTPASVRNPASCLTPRLVVGNRFLVTLTSPPGSLIRVAATTLSRCTARPAALSACCFTSHLLSSSNHRHLRWPPGEDHGGSGIWGSCSKRHSLVPTAPRQTLFAHAAARKLRRPHPSGRHQDFMPRGWPPVIWTLCGYE